MCIVFAVGVAFGALLTAIFLPSADEERQSRAVAEEHRIWHHPRDDDDA